MANKQLCNKSTIAASVSRTSSNLPSITVADGGFSAGVQARGEDGDEESEKMRSGTRHIVPVVFQCHWKLALRSYTRGMSNFLCVLFIYMYIYKYINPDGTCSACIKELSMAAMHQRGVLHRLLRT